MKKKARIISMFLTFALVFTMLIIPGVDQVKADNFKEVKYSKSIVLSTGNPTVYVNLGKRWNEKKNLVIKSSNKKVVKTMDTGYPIVDLKKAGKATVTFKTGGKTYKMKFKVLAYKNPLKAFKVDSNSVAGSFNNYSSSSLNYTDETAAIQVKPNKGWKLKSIKYKAYKYENDSVTRYSENIENNSSVTFKDNSWYSHYILVTLYNSSKGLKETIELEINRVPDDND